MRTLNVALLALAVCLPAYAEKFQPPCALHYANIAVKRPIDADCGMTGDAKTPALAAQDRAKNNFCVGGDPVLLTYEAYPKLQAAAEKALGANYKPPEDREPLFHMIEWKGQMIGEGTHVQLVAFVDRARYSDVEKGESVNCNVSGDAANDVHIPLIQKQGDEECTSVTAEMSPHFRPDSWTPSNLNHLTVPIRVSGQLFFDAAHKPCSDGKVENPKRQSVWEIHPVYAVDVCVNKRCDPTRERDWQPLNEFVAKKATTKPKTGS